MASCHSGIPGRARRTGGPPRRRVALRGIAGEAELGDSLGRVGGGDHVVVRRIDQLKLGAPTPLTDVMLT